MNKVYSSLLEQIYVDNPYLSCIHCHRLKERSFHINNRQFNICSRCTGIITGMIFSPTYYFFNIDLILVFTISLIAISLDGFTQLFKWRTSNNKLRFTTGLFFGYLLLPIISLIIYKILLLI